MVRWAAPIVRREVSALRRAINGPLAFVPPGLRACPWFLLECQSRSISKLLAGVGLDRQRCGRCVYLLAGGYGVTKSANRRRLRVDHPQVRLPRGLLRLGPALLTDWPAWSPARRCSNEGKLCIKPNIGSTFLAQLQFDGTCAFRSLWRSPSAAATKPRTTSAVQRHCSSRSTGTATRLISLRLSQSMNDTAPRGG